MQLSEAVKKIFDNVTDEFVITSTGHISREAFRYDRPRNFYMQGSMGSALAIGLGVAINQPKAKVIVISGDGAALMSLGTLALHAKLQQPNLTHYILDNNCHGSTGGQPTCSDAIHFGILAPNTHVFRTVAGKPAPRIDLSCRYIARRFREEICKL
jgi:phosphonopyruvate decarboxylase